MFIDKVTNEIMLSYLTARFTAMLPLAMFCLGNADVVHMHLLKTCRFWKPIQSHLCCGNSSQFILSVWQSTRFFVQAYLRELANCIQSCPQERFKQSLGLRKYVFMVIQNFVWITVGAKICQMNKKPNVILLQIFCMLMRILIHSDRHNRI